MLKPLLFLAAQTGPSSLDTPETQAVREGVRNSPATGLSSEVGIILAVTLLVAALVFVWAFFFRTRPQYAHGSLVWNASPSPAKPAKAAEPTVK